MLDAVSALALTEKLYGRLSRQQLHTNRLHSYFKGEQSLAFASDAWSKFHENRYRNFSDNWCGVVARAAAERAKLYGIRLGKDSDIQSEDEKQLWDDWMINNGPAQASQAFLSAAVSKYSAGLVWGDDGGEPVLSFESARQVIFNDDTAPTAAIKAWVDDDREFVTLYTRDALWKYYRGRTVPLDGGLTPSGLTVIGDIGGAAWLPRTEDDQWPLKNPLGLLPMVPIPNRPDLDDGPISDIEGTIAMQDAINLVWAYLFTAADYASMPARVVMGAERPKMPILDESGNQIGMKDLDLDVLTAGRMAWLTGKAGSDVKIGQWDAARLDVFTDVLNVMVKHVASQTRTPIHYIMGDLGNVNGETLAATELPLAQKVHEGNLHRTKPIQEIFRRMALVRGATGVAEQCRLANVQWANPETTTDAQMSDAALKDKQVGWPFAAILERRYRMSQPEIKRVISQVQEQNANPDLAGILEQSVTSGPVDAAVPASS